MCTGLGGDVLRLKRKFAPLGGIFLPPSPWVNELRSHLKGMGALHRALGLSISLWPHLWVDHMVEVAGLYGDWSLTGGFKAEGRHKRLKQEVSKRSFKGGGKGSRLRGVGKSWGELIRNDNMDYNLLNKGLIVWDPAWTKQDA